MNQGNFLIYSAGHYATGLTKLKKEKNGEEIFELMIPNTKIGTLHRMHRQETCIGRKEDT